MTGSAKLKGDQAEREAAALISDLLGINCRRKLGAGRLDDCGDLDGVPSTVIQVAWWPNDILRAVREKPVQAETQRANEGAVFAASFIRFKGGQFRVVLTPEQWATYVRESLQ